MNQVFLPLFAISALFILGLVVLNPYTGVILLIATLPIVDILPSIPLASSIFPVFGALTFGAFLLAQLNKRANQVNIDNRIIIFTLLFILWMVVSNPAAAIEPDHNNRKWFQTFVQLAILVWLAPRLLDESYKHISLFWTFSLFSGISALYAIYVGSIGGTISESIRGAGLAGAANTAARYFIIALVMAYYLRILSIKPLLRFILLLLMGVLILGTMYTVSRSGLILLMAVLGLFVFQRVDGNRQKYALLFLVIVIFTTWGYADNIIVIFRSAIPSIKLGSDTVGIRYRLWEAGWRMWLDYPVQGVGIGRYIERLVYYGNDLLPPKYLRLGAHNMYVQILSETGIVGFILFAIILSIPARRLWQFRHSGNVVKVLISQMWFVIFMILLIGGVTKNDHYDKLLWLVIGIGASFDEGVMRRVQGGDRYP